MNKIFKSGHVIMLLVLMACFMAIGIQDVKGVPLPRVGPSANPRPVPQDAIDRLNALYDEMDCRWRSLGCASTDGPFAVTYLHMTRIVKEGVEGMYFDDGALMANFTINFAHRYLEAIDKARRCSETPSHAWSEAFTYGDSKKSSVMEDAFLGINAHIVSVPPLPSFPCACALYMLLLTLTSPLTHHYLLVTMPPITELRLGAHCGGPVPCRREGQQGRLRQD